MDIKRLTPDYAVAPQIGPGDSDAIAAAGFTAVICNRPDPENPPELQSDRLRAAIEGAGLTFFDNPVVPGNLGPDVLEAQRTAITEAGGPVLAYCASGNRSALVWSLLNAGSMGIEAVLSATGAAGYDHSRFRPMLESMARG